MKHLHYKCLLILMAALFSVAARGATKVNGIYYNFNGSEASVERNNQDKYSGDIVVPSYVTYNKKTYTVTSVGWLAFYQCYELTSVTLPSTITKFDSQIFRDCWKLKSVNIPEAITKLELYTFENCYSLEKIQLPKNLVEIGTGAFENCSSLTDIIIPKTVTRMSSDAFEGCSSLQSIVVESGNTVYDSRNNCNAIINTSNNQLLQGCNNSFIPEGVTYIYYNAFKGMAGLKAIHIPASVENIGNQAFVGCSSLSSITVETGNPNFDSRNNCNAIIRTSTNELILGCKNTTIPSDVTSIGYAAFYECKGLKEIDLSGGVKNIGNSAFYGCTGITSLDIPSNITSIGYSAFYGCTGLTTLYIPANVTDILDGAFGGCYNLTSIVVDKENKYYNSNNNCNAIIKTANKHLIAGCNNTVIPSGIVSIGYSAFYGCSSLIDVVLPSTVRSIGSKAFSGCANMKTLVIPPCVTILGSLPDNCPQLTDVYLYPEEVPYTSGESGGMPINYELDSFMSTTNATLHVISSSISSYNENIWDVDQSARIIPIVAEAPDEGSLLYYYDQNCKNAILIGYQDGAEKISYWQIPETVTKDGISYTVTNINYSGYPELNAVSIPSTITNIAASAFTNCTNLKKVIVADLEAWCRIPHNYNGVLNIAGHLYADENTEITNLIIPEGITQILNYSFKGCKGITSVSMPTGLESIGFYAFQGCTSLQSVIIPNTVTTISNSFDGCTSLPVENGIRYADFYLCEVVNKEYSSYSIKDGTKWIGASTFMNCTNLSSITIPEGITHIQSSAFRSCTNLRSVVLPRSVKNLDQSIFLSCSNLQSIECKGDTTALNEYTFNGVGTINAPVKLLVPIKYLEHYQALVDANGRLAGGYLYVEGVEDHTLAYSYDYEHMTASVIGFEAGQEIADVEIPETVTYEGNSFTVTSIENKAFIKTIISSVILPRTLTNIGNSAFNGTQLQEIIIPASVTSMGSSVFSGCNNLTNIYCYAKSVPSGGKGLVGNRYKEVILHVPASSLNAYRSNVYWHEIVNIVPIDEEPLLLTSLLAEYFINTDPGLGKAMIMEINSNEKGEASFDIPASELKFGLNVIGIRLISNYEDGTVTYSPTHYQYVYRSTANEQRDIERVEYFWDVDPGKGNGIAIPFNIDGENALVQSNINYQGLYGSHVLNIRAMSHGIWSTIYQQNVLLPASVLSGNITLNPNAEEDANNGVFNLLSTLLSALSTRGFDIGLNVNVADATYNFVVSEQSIAVVQALYQYLIKMNFYISMKAPNSATFNFVMPQEFMYLHQEELPQIAAAVQAMFSHIVTENISVMINGQAYQYDGFQVEPNDLMALKNIYNRLNGENWTQKKWSFRSNGRDASEFPGVEFNTQGRVTSINLYNNNLSGLLTDEWHLEMPYLTYLNLSYNDIEGDLSPFLRYTTGLKSLYMTNNCLTEISDTLPSSLTTINLQYQFKTGYSNSELKEKFLEKQQPRRFYISNKQQLDIPSLFTYNNKYMDHSLMPTVYLLDRTTNHNSFAYYTNQYGFSWKSSGEYTDVQDARYLVELSGGTGISSNSVVPMYVRYVEGDANMSGATDVLDVQHTLNHILGSVWNFNYSAANTYTDKTINVQDIVCTVNIILAQEQSAVASSRGEQEVNTPEAWLYTRDGQLVLATSKEVGAIDVELSGVSTSQVSLLLNHSHFQMIGRNTEYGARFVIFSPTGQAIPAGELNALLRLSSHAEIVTAQIADITADEVNVVLGSEPTSIGQVRDGMMAARFQGNQLFINTTSEMNNVELRLTSTSGAVLFSTELSHVVRGETTLNVNVVPGVYVLELTNAVGARKIEKLIKR